MTFPWHFVMNIISLSVPGAGRESWSRHRVEVVPSVVSVPLEVCCWHSVRLALQHASLAQGHAHVFALRQGRGIYTHA